MLCAPLRYECIIAAVRALSTSVQPAVGVGVEAMLAQHEGSGIGTRFLDVDVLHRAARGVPQLVSLARPVLLEAQRLEDLALSLASAGVALVEGIDGDPSKATGHAIAAHALIHALGSVAGFVQHLVADSLRVHLLCSLLHVRTIAALAGLSTQAEEADQENRRAHSSVTDPKLPIHLQLLCAMSVL